VIVLFGYYVLGKLETLFLYLSHLQNLLVFTFFFFSSPFQHPDGLPFPFLPICDAFSDPAIDSIDFLSKFFCFVASSDMYFSPPDAVLMSPSNRIYPFLP